MKNLHFGLGQMFRGSEFRTKILGYLNGTPEDELKIGNELSNYWTSAKAVFPVIREVIDTSGFVAHPHLKYKGVFDCLAVFRYVRDLKNSHYFLCTMNL